MNILITVSLLVNLLFFITLLAFIFKNTTSDKKEIVVTPNITINVDGKGHPQQIESTKTVESILGKRPEEKEDVMAILNRKKETINFGNETGKVVSNFKDFGEEIKVD